MRLSFASGSGVDKVSVVVHEAASHRCPKVTRDSIVAGCVALALLLGVLAYWTLLEPWKAGSGSGGGDSGTGSGSSSGAGGTGDGTGTGIAGTGPGSGLRGDGPGADPDGKSEELQGTPDGTTPQTVAEPSGNNAPDAGAMAVPELGFSPSEEPDVPQPPTSPTPADPIGTGSAPAREGATGAARPGLPEFMGVKGDGQNVVYILDFSGSMADEKISHLKIQLKKSIFSLSSKNKFQVILFNTFAIENPKKGMLPATKQNTQACANWVDEEQVTGSTNPVQALEIALSQLKPDTIYLLTDGAFDSDADVFAVISRLNPEGKVQINTIGFGIGANVQVLERIAQENRGKYRYVDVPAPVPP